MNRNSTDRRQCARLACDQHRIRSARVRPGHSAAIVNVSAGGALVETERGLSPGTTVELQMENDAHRLLIRGRVLRCAVSQVQASKVKYRSAIAFDRHLPWCVERQGYAVPGPVMPAAREERAGATHTVL